MDSGGARAHVLAPRRVDRAPSDPGRGELEIRVEMRRWVALVVARFALAGWSRSREAQ